MSSTAVLRSLQDASSRENRGRVSACSNSRFAPLDRGPTTVSVHSGIWLMKNGVSTGSTDCATLPQENSTGDQKTLDSGRPFQRPADNAAAWTINVFLDSFFLRSFPGSFYPAGRCLRGQGEPPAVDPLPKASSVLNLKQVLKCIGHASSTVLSAKNAGNPVLKAH